MDEQQLEMAQQMHDSQMSTGSIIAMLLFYAVVLAFFVAVGWKIFQKAGEPGWAVIVPIYNLVILMKIVGRPVWWVVLMLIPCVSFVVGIILAVDLAKSFGKDTGFAVGLILLGVVFGPILAFGDARYVGPAAAGGAARA